MLELLVCSRPIWPGGHSWYCSKNNSPTDRRYNKDVSTTVDTKNLKQGRLWIILSCILHPWRFYICKTFNKLRE